MVVGGEGSGSPVYITTTYNTKPNAVLQKLDDVFHNSIPKYLRGQKTRTAQKRLTYLQNVQKLERFNLKAIMCIDEQQYEIGDLANVDHGIDIVRTLEERESSCLAADHGDRTLDLGEVVLRVMAHKILNQCGFSHTGWADNRNNSRRSNTFVYKNSNKITSRYKACAGQPHAVVPSDWTGTTQPA